MCYHGIGHLNMYITDADIDKSLELCEKIGVKDDGRSYYQTCVQGVFMIVFQGVEPEDFALVADIKPEKEGVASFCAPYSGLEYNACRTEAWPLFVDQIREPEGLTQFCSFTTDDRYNGWCYETGLSLRVLELLEIGDGAGTEAVSDYCMALPQNRRAICFSFAATRFVQVDPEYTQVSVSLCESAEKYGFRESCLDDLLYYSTYSFAKGSESHERYCSKLPNDYHARCEEGSIPDRLYSWYERN